MQEPKPPKKKRFKLSPEDSMVIFVSGLVIMASIFIWLNFPIIVSIPAIAVLLFSLYYQIMFWIKQLNTAMLGMQIDDKMLNESGYQYLKRGYDLKISVTYKNPEDPNSDLKYKFNSSIPKWRKKYIKLIVIIQIVLFPAWRFREYEGEDEIME